MLEQEVKEIVEKIVRLERESGACTREAVRLKESLEQVGITLDNDWEDVIIYQRVGRSSVSEEWMRFDTATWLWEEEQQGERTR